MAAAATAIPPPIQIFLPKEPRRCSLMFAPLKDGPNSSWAVAKFPGFCARASSEVDLITRVGMKSWTSRLRRGDCLGNPAITEATRPSGGNALGTPAKPANRRCSSSNSARAAGSAASRRSSSSASSGPASPSKTACINWVSSVGFMSIRPKILQQFTKTEPRLEQAGLHRFFIQVQDLTNLLVAQLGKVPQRQNQAVVGCHVH